MSFQIKSKWLVLGILIVFLGTLGVGWYLGHKRTDRALNGVIIALNSKMISYQYKVDSLEKTAYEKAQIIIEQREALRVGLVEKTELKALNIKKVSEVTSLKAQIRVLLDSIGHTGTVVNVVSPDTLDLEYPAIRLPFTFSTQDKYLSLKGGFNADGKMSIDINMPLSVDVWTGYDAKQKLYKAVLTYDQPYLKTIDIKSVKMDLPKPKKFGLGIQVGYGINLSKEKISAQPYIGLGISYNLIRF